MWKTLTAELNFTYSPRFKAGPRRADRDKRPGLLRRSLPQGQTRHPWEWPLRDADAAKIYANARIENGWPEIIFL